MFKVGDFVIYRRDVCQIKEIKEKLFFDKDYYIMSTIDDDSLIIKVPVEASCYLREVVSKKKANDLISQIPSIDMIDADDKDLEYEYKRLLDEGTLENLVKIIKTAYLRNQERLNQKKKIGEKDDNYFQLAEKRLYNELSVSLDLTFDETKQYVIDSVKALLS